MITDIISIYTRVYMVIVSSPHWLFSPQMWSQVTDISVMSLIIILTHDRDMEKQFAHYRCCDRHHITK